MDQISAIIALESGELGLYETLELFGELIASGLVWGLQGSYGRTATHLIESGIIDRTGKIDWEKVEELEN